jgi:hypothetical protein
MCMQARPRVHLLTQTIKNADPRRLCEEIGSLFFNGGALEYSYRSRVLDGISISFPRINSPRESLGKPVETGGDKAAPHALN